MLNAFEAALAQKREAEAAAQDPWPREWQPAAQRLADERRFIAQPISVGTAGLTERPAVYDRETERTLDVFQGTQAGVEKAQALADRLELERELALSDAADELIAREGKA